MKKSENTPKTSKPGSEQKTRVLLENMYSDIKKIAEGQVSTDTRLSKIEEVIPELIEVKSEVKAISMAVMTLNGDLKALHNDVKDLKNKVDENLYNHDKRITKLEEKVLI